MPKRVYFIGAGFSKAINPAFPTLLELSAGTKAGFLKRHPNGPIFERFRQVPSGLDANIEQLLSYLVSDWPWKTSVDKDLDLALYKALVFEIYLVLSAIQTQKPSELVLDLLKFIADDSDNSIVSLNYDNLVESLHARFWRPSFSAWIQGVEIVIEERYKRHLTTAKTPCVTSNVAANTVRLTVSRDWVMRQTPETFKQTLHDTEWRANLVSSQYGDGAFKKVLGWLQGATEFPKEQTPQCPLVLHLHGSINWTNEEGRDDSLRIVLDDGSTRVERIPYIVPPVVDKSRHYSSPRLREEWSKAYSAIEGASELVLIGFSFPMTDLSCQFLFKSAARPGVRVVVVNSDPSVEANYRSVFGHIPDVAIDCSYCRREDPLGHYIGTEVWA